MLEWKGLCAAYAKKQVLFSLDGRLEPGCFLGIVGPNGSGKSTLLKTLSLLLSPSAGELWLDGERPEKMPRIRLARKLAYLSQEQSVPPMSVEQMVLHGRFCHHSYPCVYHGEDRRLARQAMEAMGVASLAESPVATLSGGTVQRVRLAALYCQDSPYLLLDEPISHLDVGAQLSLMNRLRAMAEEGKAVAAVLHDLPLAFSFCHRILLLHQGRTVALSAPDELCRSGLTEAVFGVGVARQGDGGYAYRYGGPRGST